MNQNIETKRQEEQLMRDACDPRECACCASARRFEAWWPWELRLLKFSIIIIIIIIIIIAIILIILNNNIIIAIIIIIVVDVSVLR